MPLDSTKTIVDYLRKEVSFCIGRVKNPQFLFPAKKAVDVRRAVVKRLVGRPTNPNIFHKNTKEC
jgi:hypothetical protein